MKRDPLTGFKVKFNILDYEDILPEMPPFEDILNHNKPAKESVWKRIKPDEITPEFKAMEVERCLRTGVWIFINLQPIWIPPNYYFFLQYGFTGDNPPEFRLKRLKHVYFKLRVRKNPRAIGTYTIKNRQDGETTSAMHDAFWEMHEGNLNNGQIGIQSKTNEDAKNPCWLTCQLIWANLPLWYKDVFFSDFASEGASETKMVLKRDVTEGKSARNVRITYYPAVANAMDGKNSMRICILDEVNKWEVCSFYDTYICYKKFIAVGSSRRGLFNMFSSPSEKNGRANDEALQFWRGCNPDEITETGTTATRVYRYHSNPLDGIEGFYDEFGDADSDEIYAHIMAERKNVPEDKRQAEIRAFPMNEEEMFGSFDGGSVFSNIRGIKDRNTFLNGRRYKDSENKEPILSYGNLEFPDGDTTVEPVFRRADRNEFNLTDARFAVSYFPQYKIELRNIYTPPQFDLVENILGVDPFNFVYPAKNQNKQSNGAIICRKFRDYSQNGINKIPTMIYNCRPQHIDTFYMDIIKAAIYNRAPIQIENKTDGFMKFAEENGFLKWLIPTIGETASSKRFGDGPSGKNGFLNEIIGLINANTNTPISEDEPYNLDEHWFSDLLSQYIDFDPLNTQKSDLVMADGQALLGAIKLMNKKIRTSSRFNDIAVNYYN